MENLNVGNEHQSIFKFEQLKFEIKGKNDVN